MQFLMPKIDIGGEGLKLSLCDQCHQSSSYNSPVGKKFNDIFSQPQPGLGFLGDLWNIEVDLWRQVYRGVRYIDEKLSKADKLVFLKLSANYRYRKMEILKLSKNYRYRKMHQILADK